MHYFLMRGSWQIYEGRKDAVENNISTGRGIVKSRGAGAGAVDIASTLPLVLPSNGPWKLELPLAGGLWGWGDKRFGY